MLDGETGVGLFYILDNWKSAIILIVKSIFFHEINPRNVFFFFVLTLWGNWQSLCCDEIADWTEIIIKTTLKRKITFDELGYHSTHRTADCCHPSMTIKHETITFLHDNFHVILWKFQVITWKCYFVIVFTIKRDKHFYVKIIKKYCDRFML